MLAYFDPQLISLAITSVCYAVIGIEHLVEGFLTEMQLRVAHWIGGTAMLILAVTIGAKVAGLVQA